MMTYFFQVSLCWMGFYTIYVLLLSKETFFGLNRWYLLGTVLLGLIIPVVELDWFIVQPAAMEVYYLQPITIGFSEIRAAVTAQPEENALLPILLKWAYWLGFAVCSTRFFYGFFQIRKFYKKGEITRQKDYNLITTDLPHSPFSFFKNMFWSRKFEVSGEERQNIIRHEEAHIYQWHSIDVVLLESLSVVFWFCPFIYFYKKSMEAVHEYLADAYVLRTARKKQYAHLLLRQSRSGPRIAVMNSLFNSQLKKRIVMMTKNKSSRQAALKYLAILPLLSLLCLAFSLSEKMPSQFTPSNEVVVTDTLPPEEEIFKVVEDQPRFPGCEELAADERKKCADNNMLQFIYQNIKYPKEAREKGIEGMVVTSFIIEKDGSISSAKIVRAIGAGCDEEVLRVVQEMPNWIPGKQRGRNVRVQFNLPVKFKLDSPPTLKKEDDPTKLVDTMPRFAGCETAEDKDRCANENLFRFIGENMKYPAAAKKEGIEGKVAVKFTVGKDGAIRDAGVVKGIGGGCDEEALRVVNAMPAWTPGVKDGQPVDVSMVLPFVFKTNENEKAVPDKSSQIAAYPNPARGSVTVEFQAAPGTVILTLADVSGREVFNQTFSGYDGTQKKISGIDISKAAKGNLVITLTDGKGNYLNSVQVIVQ